MRDVCSMIPIVNGEPSKLYSELFTLTNKDRKLTNFLYALSQQDVIKRMFGPSDKNSQGEPNTKVFVDKLKVADILSEKGTINAKAKALGAVNSKGDRIYYDDMMTITQKVLDFNDDPDNDKVKAAIKYTSDGFYIEVDTINSENYNTNNSLNSRINLYNALLDRFEKEGLDTAFSDDSKKALNPLNVYYAINTLRTLKKNTDNISPSTAALLADLFASDPLMARLKSQFGDDLPKALSQASGYSYGSALTISSIQQRQLEDMLSNINLSMKRVMNSAAIDQMIEDNKTNTAYTPTYAGTDGLSIKQVLKELYTQYHLDSDSISMLNKRVKTISEAANKLLQIKLALINEDELKGKSSDRKVKLRKRQKEIEQERYIVSIAAMLQDIVNSLGNIERKITKTEKKIGAIEKNPNSLTAIRDLSQDIIEHLRLVDAYEDIVKQLANYDFLENDDFTGSEDILDDIKSTAEELSKMLSRLKENARLKQVDVVKAFLKIYWGEDKVLPDGTTVSVADIMNMAIKDPNIFDRFIYAANETNDEMMNVIADAVKKANDRRDDVLKKKLKEVRAVTKTLYDSGSDTSFMYEKDSEGYPSKIISDYDYARFDEELADYMEQIKNDPNIDKANYEDLRKDWIQKHSRSVNYNFTDSKGNSKSLRLTVPIYDAPVKVKDRLSTSEYDYYKKMMDMKADMLSRIDAQSNNTLFDVIEIANDVTTALQEAGGDPVKAYRVIKNKVADMLQKREDDTSYGSILDANNLKLTHTNYKGEQINTLPLFYQRKIEDRSRVSTDFSRSMIAYLAMAEQYVQMNEILDVLLLAKDYMLTQREVAEDAGGSVLTDIQKLGKKAYVGVASKLGVSTDLKGLADDFYERVVFGRARKDEGYLWGTKIKKDKAVDFLTGYTSVAGLTTNLLGAEANVLMGKLQMLIEAGIGFGGEFFNMKDLTYADVKYFQLLPELLIEANNTTKSSLLGLLMQEFDAENDFYERIKETGFYNNPISKIIGNTNLFMLYGLGEHLLHGQGMIAVLHNKSNYVLNDAGEEVPLIEAFEVIKDNTGNGELVVKAGYTQKNGQPIDREFINKIKGRIKYVNKSLHGAYDSYSKGMIHRYAVGRLIMNFRQWMPAHYERRFRGLHYDADLGEYREGFYVSSYKFVKGCIDDLRHAKLQIGTRWHELSDMEKYNLRRTMAEVSILAVLVASIALLADYKDKKGNWAHRHLVYQLKRLQMEVLASTPIWPPTFIKNVIKILNSPAAALNTIDDLADLLKVTDAFVTIESGRNKGENKYVHTLEKKLPFYDKLKVFSELGENNDAFKLFDY